MEPEDPDKGGLIFVVVGNKCDLTDGRQVESDLAREFCKTHGFQFYEASAKTGFQVTEAFDHIVQKGVEKSENNEFAVVNVEMNIDDNVDVGNDTPDSAGCAC